MKTAIILGVIVWVSSFSFEQTPEKQYPLPEFNDKPFYYNPSSNELIELEQSQYNTLTKATGLGTARSGFFIKGISSSVRIQYTPNQNFIVRVIPGADPKAVLDLVAYSLKSDMRVLIVSKANAWSGSSSTSYDKINYQVRKIADGVYLLTVNDLQPGEYFWGSKDFMFAFGVDR